MHRKWRYTKWRYRRPPPEQKPAPTRPPLGTAATFTLGVVVWIAGFAWGVVLVVAGLAGLFIVGFWGVRATRGIDPNDGSQWPGATRGLINTDWPPPP